MVDAYFEDQIQILVGSSGRLDEEKAKAALAANGIKVSTLTPAASG